MAGPLPGNTTAFYQHAPGKSPVQNHVKVQKMQEVTQLIPHYESKQRSTRNDLQAVHYTNALIGSGATPLDLTDDQSIVGEVLLSRSTTTKHGADDGSQAGDLKERRFFQKKDLQLQTALRNGPDGTAQSQATAGMFILSPEQVKFNQEHLQERFLLETASASRTGAGGDSRVEDAISLRQTPINAQRNDRQVHNRNSQSRTLNRNLESELTHLNSGGAPRGRMLHQSNDFGFDPQFNNA